MNLFSSFQRTRMLVPSPGERDMMTAERFLYFFLVFGISGLGRGAISAVIGRLAPGIDPSMSFLADLFGTAVAIAAVILWCCLYDRRQSITLGFVRRGMVVEYAIGLVVGGLLFGAAVAVAVLSKSASVTVIAADDQPAWWLLGLFLAGFLIQGMSEELLCRSMLMVSLSRAWPMWACIVANAGIFAAMHLMNPGISVIPILNIFLFGVLASLMTLRRGSIWMVSAVHSLWNFAQGNLFGIPVSGLAGMPAPLSTTLHTDTPWQTLIGGGAFGIEGGLAATAVLLVGILLLMVMRTKKSEVVSESPTA